MPDTTNPADAGAIVATIENAKNPTQVIQLRYLREENAFVTSGILTHFDEREILIPAHLIIMDLRLMGSIIATILEKLSEVHDKEGSFHYASRLNVLDKAYSLEPYGDYIRLEALS